MKKILIILSIFITTQVFADTRPVLDNAEDIGTDTSGFNNKLSSSDDDVQKALDTIDNFNFEPPLTKGNLTTSTTGLVIGSGTNAVIGSGTTINTDTGYGIPTTTKMSNWDTAYGWGNHASAGYLTTVTVDSPLSGAGTSASHLTVDLSSKQNASSSLTSLSGLTWSSGSPLVKMTAANTFGLDATAYLSSESDPNAVLSDGTRAMSGNLTITKTDPTVIYNAGQTSDTKFWSGVQDDNANDDDDLFQIGDGITPGTNPFLTIKTDGSVGIGTTNPGYKVDVNGSLGINGSITQYLSGSTVNLNGMGSPYTGAWLNFNYDSGSAHTSYRSEDGWGGFIIYSSGTQGQNRVTIGGVATAGGAANPVDRSWLKIDAKYNQASGAFSNTDLWIARTETAITSGAQYMLRGSVGPTDKFYINNVGGGYFAGNVGIGTTGPTARLMVQGDGANNSFQVVSSAGANQLTISSAGDASLGGGLTIGTGSTLLFGSCSTISSLSDGTLRLLNHAGTSFTALNLGLATSAFPELLVNGSDLQIIRGDGTTAANLLVSGNVGIGTTAPTGKLDVNSDIIRVRTSKTPASAGAAGNAGDICWDADYVYICVATNTWKRASILTW